jgi:hypothetical protein
MSGISGQSSIPRHSDRDGTGQAAGVCTALAARSGRIPREIPASDVQRELLQQGASLRPEIRKSLSHTAL